MKYIELSHTLKNNMPVYPGDETPRLVEAGSVEVHGIGKFDITSGLHTGTHLDAPRHMIAKGKLISDYSLERFFGKGVIIDAEGASLIDRGLLEGIPINQGDIVIVNTGWHKKFGNNEYFKNYPLVTEGFAHALVALKPSLLCLDTAGPDDAPFNVHKILLSQDILIAENLTNTEALIGKIFTVFAWPINIEADASFARIVARID